jgi:SAM-dependent methyltransferase
MPQSITDRSELTSPGYWDTWWQLSRHVHLKDHDPQYGKNGYFIKALERLVGALIGRSVVELGGSMSYRLISLAKHRGMRATAVDYSPAGIDASRTFYVQHGCEIDLICADFFSPHLNGRRFDLVTHWGVLEHQVDPAPLIHRSAELTAPGGYVVFAMPQMRGPGAWLWRKYSPKSLEHHIYHPDEKILDAFSSIGWCCSRAFWGQPFIHMTPCETVGFLPSVLSQAQTWAGRLARLGVPYQYGMPYISEYRGFVAHKIAK